MSKVGRTKRSQSNSKKQAKSESPEKVTETCFVFLIYDRTKEPQAKYWCGDFDSIWGNYDKKRADLLLCS